MVEESGSAVSKAWIAGSEATAPLDISVDRAVLSLGWPLGEPLVVCGIRRRFCLPCNEDEWSKVHYYYEYSGITFWYAHVRVLASPLEENAWEGDSFMERPHLRRR